MYVCVYVCMYVRTTYVSTNMRKHTVTRTHSHALYSHTCTHSPLVICSSLEYDPSQYGLYLHDETAMPRQAKLWDYLDQKFTSGYQDTLVLHLEPSPLRAELAGEEGR